MVHRRLCLEDIDEVILMWISKDGHKLTLKNDQSFFWFWDNDVVNGNVFIQLVVKIKNPEWEVTPKKTITPKKTVSKSPDQVRRIPRLVGEKNKSVGGATSRKLFGQGSSQPTQASVIGDNLREGSSSTPVQVDEELFEVDDEFFNEEYWLKKMKEKELDETVIQLENKELDECHPVEDP
ncbi:hypothetical protein MKW92_033997, partial [Papaver armeniacum]